MVAEPLESTSFVLVVSRHKDFATAVSGQLLGLDLGVQSLLPEAARDLGRLRQVAPDIAFVDVDAVTDEGFPLHKALANAVPDCQIILLCDRSQAEVAAKLVRVCEVFDYVLIDGPQDPHRTAVLIDRARTNGLPKLAEIRGFAKIQYRRILDTLAELRAILKSDADNPVVRLIRDYRLGNELTDLCGFEHGKELAEQYKRCLVDLICGRLRRLERDVLASEARDATADKAVTDTILIVEDDVVSAELAKFILERNGFAAVVGPLGRRRAARHGPPGAGAGADGRASRRGRRPARGAYDAPQHGLLPRAGHRGHLRPAPLHALRRRGDADPGLSAEALPAERPHREGQGRHGVGGVARTS